MLTRRRLFTSALFTVVGTENHQRVCIERTPARAELRWAEPDTPLVTTNHYRKLDDAGRGKLEGDAAQFFESTCGRYDRLLQLAGQMLSAPEVTSQALLRALTDEDVIQDITAQHVIMQPSSERIELYVPRRLVEA